MHSLKMQQKCWLPFNLQSIQRICSLISVLCLGMDVLSYRSSVMKYRNNEHFTVVYFFYFFVVFVKYIHRTRNMAFIMRAFV